jgi:hypothetical protein
VTVAVPVAVVLLRSMAAGRRWCWCCCDDVAGADVEVVAVVVAASRADWTRAGAARQNAQLKFR